MNRCLVVCFIQLTHKTHVTSRHCDRYPCLFISLSLAVCVHARLMNDTVVHTDTQGEKVLIQVQVA